jgi:hypothetical protein
MTRQPLLKKIKAKRQYPESDLQRAIVQTLMLMGKPDVVWYASTNGVKMAIRTAEHMKRMGMIAGVADLAFVIQGQAYFMELKSEKGKQSPEQKAFETRVFAAKGIYVIVNNINTALDYLMAWGAIKAFHRTRSPIFNEVAA